MIYFDVGDEYQTEIVKDFLMYLYNNNKKVYFMLEDHYRFDEMMTHVHVPKKSMLNKVRNTLTLTKMRHRGRVAPTNIRNNQRSKVRSRTINNSSLDNL